MDQLLDQLRPGSTCSSSQPLSRAAGVNSDGSKSSNSSQSSSQAQAAASVPVPQSPAALSSAEVHTSACTSLLASYSAAPGRTWCVMELPHDCIVSFESDAGEAAQQHTAQQSQCAVHGSNSGDNSSKTQQQQQQQPLLSAACASQYFSAAAAMTAASLASLSAAAAAAAAGTSNQYLSAAYHTLPACSDFCEAWPDYSAAAAAAAAPPLQGEREVHIHLLQQQLQQQLGIGDSFDSLAELPLHNPYEHGARARCSWAAGAECFVGEF
uniref:Uncharacterized protein n=1 Tax=Tetradesmus obliquus TaxID=3088 RepID=A0A383WFP8_TETOB